MTGHAHAAPMGMTLKCKKYSTLTIISAFRLNGGPDAGRRAAKSYIKNVQATYVTGRGRERGECKALLQIKNRRSVIGRPRLFRDEAMLERDPGVCQKPVRLKVQTG